MPRTRRTGRTRREIRNANALKAQRRQPCMRCGQPIDYAAPHTAPSSFSAGHIKAWVDHPGLREDPANLQQEHRDCNSQAQDRDPLPPLGQTSRRW